MLPLGVRIAVPGSPLGMTIGGGAMLILTTAEIVALGLALARRRA